MESGESKHRDAQYAPIAQYFLLLAIGCTLPPSKPEITTKYDRFTGKTTRTLRFPRVYEEFLVTLDVEIFCPDGADGFVFIGFISSNRSDSEPKLRSEDRRFLVDGERIDIANLVELEKSKFQGKELGAFGMLSARLQLLGDMYNVEYKSGCVYECALDLIRAETLHKIANANNVECRAGSFEFRFTPEQLAEMKKFCETANLGVPN